jgi:hypothetical protein
VSKCVRRERTGVYTTGSGWRARGTVG